MQRLKASLMENLPSAELLLQPPHRCRQQHPLRVVQHQRQRQKQQLRRPPIPQPYQLPRPYQRRPQSVVLRQHRSQPLPRHRSQPPQHQQRLMEKLYALLMAVSRFLQLQTYAPAERRLRYWTSSRRHAAMKRHQQSTADSK